MEGETPQKQEETPQEQVESPREQVETPQKLEETLQKPKLAISFDVECTGDTPATGSCIMIGFAAVLENTSIREIKDDNSKWYLWKKRWYVQEYNGRGERCMKEFWSKYPENLENILKAAVHPTIVCQEISDLLRDLSKIYDWYFVADPASFDWAWLSHLYDKFGPADRTYLGYKAICMDGMEKALMYMGYSYSDVDCLLTPPKELNLVMSHYADDDALFQAYGYLNLLQEFRVLGTQYGRYKDA